MFVENALHKENPLVRRNVGKPDQPTMGVRTMEDQLQKVLVQGDEDPVLSRGCREQLPIPGIGPDDLRDIMSLLSQPYGDSSAGTAVDEEPHRLSPTCTASSRSPAIAARA